jgi:hypothetical protein
MFSLGSIKYLASEMNYFFICPAAMVILDFRWSKTKLFKRVKYDAFNISQIFLSETVKAFVSIFGWNVHWVVLEKISGFKMIANWWHQNGV